MVTIDYASPTKKKGYSRYAIASVCMAALIILFGIWVLAVDDPFQSMGNQKPIRICTVAGILGMFLALRGSHDQHNRQRIVRVAIVANVLAALASWIFLPCL